MLSTAKGTTPTRVPGRLWESVEGPWEKVREEKGQAEWARRSAALPPPPPRCPAHSCLFLLALWPAQGARGAQGAGQGHGKEGKSRRRNQEEVCRWAQNLFFFFLHYLSFLLLALLPQRMTMMKGMRVELREGREREKAKKG